MTRPCQAPHVARAKVGQFLSVCPVQWVRLLSWPGQTAGVRRLQIGRRRDDAAGQCTWVVSSRCRPGVVRGTRCKNASSPIASTWDRQRAWVLQWVHLLSWPGQTAGVRGLKFAPAPRRRCGPVHLGRFESLWARGGACTRWKSASLDHFYISGTAGPITLKLGMQLVAVLIGALHNSVGSANAHVRTCTCHF